MLLRRAGQAVQLQGSLGAVLDAGVQPPVMVVLYGLPGTGKSHMALGAADAWPGRAIVLCFEQGLGPTLVDLVRRVEALRPDYAVADGWDEILELIAGYDLVVVDSAQAVEVTPSQWRAATVDMGRSLIMTSQVNAAGDVRGGLACGHIADIVVELLPERRFRVAKYRGGDLHEGTW